MSLANLPNELVIPILSLASAGLEAEIVQQRSQSGLYSPWSSEEQSLLALLHFRLTVGLTCRSFCMYAMEAFFDHRRPTIRLGFNGAQLCNYATLNMGDFKQLWEREETKYANGIEIGIYVDGSGNERGLARKLGKLLLRCKKLKAVKIEVVTNHHGTPFRRVQPAQLWTAREALYERLAIVVDEVGKKMGVMWDVSFKRIENHLGGSGGPRTVELDG